MAAETLDLRRYVGRWTLSAASHVGRVSFELTRAYLHGIQDGLRLAGVPSPSSDDFDAAAASRGWDCRGSEGIVRDFRRKKLTEAEMVQELVAVEVEAYRLAAVRRGSSISN